MRVNVHETGEKMESVRVEFARSAKAASDFRDPSVGNSHIHNSIEAGGWIEDAPPADDDFPVFSTPGVRGFHIESADWVSRKLRIPCPSWRRAGGASHCHRLE